MGLSPETLALLDYAAAMRRALHRIPERGLEEQQTQRFLLEQLSALGIHGEAVAGTGVKAVLRGGKPGPVTALRADMDALNVHEKTGCDFASERQGWMHACGHDGHMAALLAAARLLNENLQNVSGTVVLLFQPCEELVKGARLLLEAGALDNPAVDRVFAFHLMPHLAEGTIGVVQGPVMAAACEFAIDVNGRSAHGAMPHLAVDAIAAAAAFVTGAQSVVSRVKPPEAPGLLTFGKFVGGSRHNIIAGSVELEGTLRAYDDGVMASMRNSLLNHLKGLEQAWGVTTAFRVLTEVPVTANDPPLAQLALALAPDLAGAAAPLTVAEDFSLYRQKAPAFMGLLGCRNEEAGFTEPLHSDRFNFREHALLAAVEFYRRLLIT